jgi:hypothetical protein
MIEIRKVSIRADHWQLEYRWRILATDASGALCSTDKWSDWKRVETIDADDAAYEDLRASGGLYPLQGRQDR